MQSSIPSCNPGKIVMQLYNSNVNQIEATSIQLSINVTYMIIVAAFNNPVKNVQLKDIPKA